MRRIRGLLLLTLVAAALASPAFADGETDDDLISIGPRAAYFDPKQDGADGVWFGGAQLRVYFGTLAIEGSVDYREVDAGNSIDVQTYPVQASLLIYLIENKPVSLYLLGGGGWYFTRIDGPSGFDDQTDEDFGPHAGAGVQAWISDHVSLDVDWRYIWLSELDFDDGSLVKREYDPSGSMFTGAINFHF